MVMVVVVVVVVVVVHILVGASGRFPDVRSGGDSGLQPGPCRGQ
jgi:hypothetical protein